MNTRIELKNHQKEIYNFRLRLLLCALFVLLLIAILCARMIYLQVVRYEHFQTLAEDNRISVEPIVPNRGLILDRNGVVIADNYAGYTLELTADNIERHHKNRKDDINEILDRLSTLIEITPEQRAAFFKQLKKKRSYESVIIRSRLSDAEVARFAAQQYRFPGIDIKARLFRDYPFGAQMAHLTGYIGRINKEDQQRLREQERFANYRGSDYIGKIGLEKQYETELHGVTGIKQVEVDSGGRPIRLLSRTPPQSGNNLILTIDTELQSLAVDALGEYRGAIVALNPKNGEVLALVSKPGYDPGLFVDGIDHKSWNQLNNSPDHPLNNRVLRGQYPAGSTIKPFLALAGLHYNLRTPEYTISDPGYFSLPNSTHRYRDWKWGGHGQVNLFKSIVISCDTYYYSLATDMGIRRIHEYMSLFNFGKKSGIDLGGELTGLLPSPEWKQRRHQQQWYIGDTVSVGIGQGYSLVTPLQLAYATAILANDGIAYRPHLVKAIHNTNNDIYQTIENPPAFKVDIPPQDLALVKQAMVAVTEPGGTAVRATQGTPYQIAGKTGTAQVITIAQGERYNEEELDERHRDHAWFMGFAPADNPTIAVVALVENGGHGGATAAPIVRQIMDKYLLNETPTVATESPDE